MERISSSESRRALSLARLLPKGIDRLPRLASVALADSQIFLCPEALFQDGFQLQLPLSEGCGDIFFRGESRSRSPMASCSSRVARELSRSMPARYSSICAS